MKIHLKQHKKLYGLLGVLALCLVLALVYLFQTFGIWSQASALEKRLEEASLAHSLISSERLKVEKLDSEIQQLQAREVRIGSHVEFLEYTESLCEQLDLRLIDLPTEEIETLDGYRLAHIRLRLSGNFHDLLRFLYQIEQKDRSASVAHCAFKMQSIRFASGRKEVLTLSAKLNRLIDKPNNTKL